MLHAQKPASSSKRKIFIIELPSPREKASKIKAGRKLAFSQVYKAMPRGTMRATLSSENRGPRINETLSLGQRVRNDTGGCGGHCYSHAWRSSPGTMGRQAERRPGVENTAQVQVWGQHKIWGCEKITLSTV